MKRLLFFRPAQAMYRPPRSIPFSTSVPVSAGNTIAENTEVFSLIGNNGNMVHRIAMLQMLAFDRERSAQGNLIRWISQKGSVEHVAKAINKQFDGIVLTFANNLQPGITNPGMAELIERLEIDVYAFGLGLQDEYPAGARHMLTDKLLSLLEHINRKARIFAVRGYMTEAWLHSIGFDRAEALGCHSFFAYPHNVLALSAPEHLQSDYCRRAYLQVFDAGRAQLSVDGGVSGR